MLRGQRGALLTRTRATQLCISDARQPGSASSQYLSPGARTAADVPSTPQSGDDALPTSASTCSFGGGGAASAGMLHSASSDTWSVGSFDVARYGGTGTPGFGIAPGYVDDEEREWNGVVGHAM